MSKDSKSDKISVVLLCAGSGKRLRPLSLLTPKPLVPLGSTTSLLKLVHDISNRYCSLVEQVVIVLGYAAVPYLKDLQRVCERLPVRVDIVVDSRLRGTAGHLRTVLSYVDTKYMLLINGDIVLDDRSYENIMRSVANAMSEETELLIFYAKKPIRFGVIKYDSNYNVVEWLEKPLVDVVAGIYLLNKDVVSKLLRKGENLVNMNDLVKLACERGVKVKAAQISGLVEDIGVVEDYLRIITTLSEDYLR